MRHPAVAVDDAMRAARGQRRMPAAHNPPPAGRYLPPSGCHRPQECRAPALGRATRAAPRAVMRRQSTGHVWGALMDVGNFHSDREATSNACTATWQHLIGSLAFEHGFGHSKFSNRTLKVVGSLVVARNGYWHAPCRSSARLSKAGLPRHIACFIFVPFPTTVGRRSAAPCK